MKAPRQEGNRHVQTERQGRIDYRRHRHGRGIRANVISPGPIDTPLNDKLGLDPEAAKARAKAVVGLVPAGRFGTAEEIANAVVFLASDESRSWSVRKC
ncbi:SDR family oxidoreductase [Mesorhizobium sp. M1409]|uniref:SDR family oxidoreductase n=1 Tax=unclassified Mesorhizobium TaxID=325217 RepID=UPI00333C52B7